LSSKRFFINSAEIEGEVIQLTGEEHYHLSRVVRIRRGAMVDLFDEKGCCYRACVEHTGRERTRLRLIEENEPEIPRLRIVLAQSIIKSRKMETALQKGTELGVTTFIPIVTHRSVIEPGLNSGKIARWQRILREAMKQSGRSDPPEIKPVVQLSDFLETGGYGDKILLWERKGKPLKEILQARSEAGEKTTDDPDSVVVLVGPEGGWTEEEYQRIMNHGYTAVTLGRNVLRSETAAIAGVAMIAHFWNL